MIDIRIKLSAIKQKLKETDFKKLVRTKAFVTVGCLVMVCAAVLIASVAGGSPGETAVNGDTSGTRVLGNSVLVDSAAARETGGEPQETEASAVTDGDFFAMAMINRTQTRDSALEVLRAIAESPEAMPDAKESALNSIAAIAGDMAAETNIETLVKARGIADCVAVISGKTCSVIVNTERLSQDEVTQIAAVVREQTGIPTENITVVEAKRNE
ncbi:MAG: SpoIIIAH-like family protein [Clostridia bacterium]|nr:SpoIIIAH-like family protein [Clostridia bacterium]